MLQQEKPDDYVIATGKCNTVEEFLQKSFALLEMDYRNYLKIDTTLYRPSEVMVLMGNYSKAERTFGWQPTTSFEELTREMVESDLALYS